MTAGKLTWFIPDGYMNPTANGEFVSHEAVCALNVGDTEAHIRLTIFFEDREPMTGFTAVCAARRTNHIRLDKLVSATGEKIPKGISYAVLCESDAPIIMQHSRMDVSQPEMALMTTIPFGM